MVNENFEKFREVQKKHQGPYLAGTSPNNPQLNKDDYNSQENTDKAPGASGRKIRG